MQHCWILLYIAVAAMVGNCNVQGLRIDVTPIQSRFAAVQDVKVVLTYTNDEDQMMGVYRWYLPENGLYDELFEVTRNGKKVEYVGPIVKRRAPTADDVIYLEPGMAKSTLVELSSVFNMTLTGNYMIQYKANADQVLIRMESVRAGRSMPSNDDQDVVLESAPVMVFAVGRRNQLIEDAIKVNAQTRAMTATYASCSSTQINAIKSGITSAESYAISAMQYLNGQASATSRYTTWFGTFSSSNWQSLKANFARVQNILTSQSLSFDCSCPAAGSGTYAYVYASQHYRIYLCNQYWLAGLTGTDSQAGTIIHEIAHFTVAMGTTDHAYGHSSAKALAASSPAKALANSDNVQYFVENNPRLS